MWRNTLNCLSRNVLWITNGLLIAMFLSFPALSLAKDYPAKPIKVIVGFKAGGGVDTFTRTVGRYAEKYFGEKFVIMNKPGAGGQIGWNSLAQSKPDGYTLAATVIPNIILQPRLRGEGTPGYETSDLVHIGTVCQIPTAVFTSLENDKFKTMADVISYAKDNPGKISAGLAAVKSGPHALALMIEKQQEIDLNIIPSGGGAPLFKQVLGGHVDLMMANAMFAVKNKDTLRCLGVASSKPFSLAPDVPTFKSQGIEVVDFLTRGLAAPKGTPKEIVEHLRDGLQKMTEDEEFINDLRKVGLAVDYMSGEETEKYIDTFLQEKSWVIESFKQK